MPCILAKRFFFNQINQRCILSSCIAVFSLHASCIFSCHAFQNFHRYVSHAYMHGRVSKLFSQVISKYVKKLKISFQHHSRDELPHCGHKLCGNVLQQQKRELFTEGESAVPKTTVLSSVGTLPRLDLLNERASDRFAFLKKKKSN